MREHKFTREDFLLDSVDLVLSELPCNGPSGHKDVSYPHGVLTLKDMADVVALRK